MEKRQITQSMVDAIIPARAPESDKNTYGRILCLCGSVGYTGAAYFAAQAAVRTGSGVVTLAVPRPAWAPLAVKLNEAVVLPLEADEEGRFADAALSDMLRLADKADAVLIGCGIGRSAALTQLVCELVSRCKRQIVLDADGINAVAAHIHILKHASMPVIVTPHRAEFRRLFGLEDPGDALLCDMAGRHGCHIVYKQHRTRVALADGTLLENSTGNPGMAKGGSGDVLAGMIASLCGQGIDAGMAAAAAVFLHGQAGDIAASRLSEYGMTPSDMLAQLPHVFKRYNTREW